MSYKFDITIDYALPWQPVLDFLIAPTFKMQPYWLKMIILKYKKIYIDVKWTKQRYVLKWIRVSWQVDRTNVYRLGRS
jgi:hypothetical protein